MNSRFAVAVHVLTLIDEGAGEPVTSESIASSVNTNPALIRRLLGMLAKAGLTTAQLGNGGGALLARPAAEISLLDVHRAVDQGEIFGLHTERPNPSCPIGRNIRGALTTKIDAATQALEAELARTNIGDILRDVRRRERQRAS
jgi:DNA-binding IscR family transcriptional regulator